MVSPRLLPGSLKHLENIDCLPYHVMGVSKYKEMGLTYRLEGIPAAPKSLAAEATKVVLEGLKAYRRGWWSPNEYRLHR